MASACVSATIGTLVMDEATADSDGNLWTVESLDGWFDGPPIRAENVERAARGETITLARINAREITLTCVAYLSGRAMGSPAAFQAQRRLKGVVIPGAAIPLTLLVTDPDLALRASVRLWGAIKTQVLGSLAMVRFSVPLLAADPRRYAQSLTTVSLTTGVNTVMVAGNLSTPPTFTITGAHTNAVVQNQTLSNNPTLGWIGSIPGGQDLVLNTSTEGVTLNGVNARDGLTTAEWFDLLPGSNDIAVFQNTTMTYRTAYL